MSKKYQPAKACTLVLGLASIGACSSTPSETPNDAGRDSGVLADSGATDSGSRDANTDSALPAVTALSVEASGFHTCAVVSNDKIRCWGQNEKGQIGSGSEELQVGVPEEVVGISGANLQVALGYQHTCAILSNGAVSCWGDNEEGQLGNASNASSGTPVPVSGIDGSTPAKRATQISASLSTTCVRLESGTAMCWGYGESGQLGNEANQNSNVPVEVRNLTGVVSIAAGIKHTCALITGGQVKCWGNNEFGQLGTGNTTSSPTPVSVNLGNGAMATQIDAGDHYTCAVLSTGDLRCWGINEHGQIDISEEEFHSTAIGIALGATASAVSAGPSHACAIMNSGEVKCWGRSDYGQLGNGVVGEDPSAPVVVSNLGGGPTSIATGEYHSCARIGNGQARCWGWNNGLQLGDRTQETRPAPVSVVF